MPNYNIERLFVRGRPGWASEGDQGDVRGASVGVVGIRAESRHCGQKYALGGSLGQKISAEHRGVSISFKRT